MAIDRANLLPTAEDIATAASERMDRLVRAYTDQAEAAVRSTDRLVAARADSLLSDRQLLDGSRQLIDNSQKLLRRLAVHR
jgi:hypothetical protein